MEWSNPDFKIDIEEVVGNESDLELGSSVSVTRRFQIRQVEHAGTSGPIPFALANLVFYDYIMQFEPFYVDLPFRYIRFVEDKDKIGEIFDAEVVYSLEYPKYIDEDAEREFTLPTFSVMGGKKKQFRPADVPNAVERYVRDGETPVEYKMLGWDGKQFNGAEVECADLKFMIPAWYPATAMKFLFFKRLKQYIGSVNSEEFYGMEPGECKYLGPEQSWTTRTIETGNPDRPSAIIRVMELQHHFQVQLNEYDVMIDEISIPFIPGWAYADFKYEDSLVDIGEKKKVPLAVLKQVDIVKVSNERDHWELFDGRILEGLWMGPAFWQYYQPMTSDEISSIIREVRG